MILWVFICRFSRHANKSVSEVLSGAVFDCVPLRGARPSGCPLPGSGIVFVSGSGIFGVRGKNFNLCVCRPGTRENCPSRPYASPPPESNSFPNPSPPAGGRLTDACFGSPVRIPSPPAGERLNRTDRKFFQDECQKALDRHVFFLYTVSVCLTGSGGAR